MAKYISMQVASMGATTLSYKDFDPAYVAAETEARIAVIEKDNIELGRLGKNAKKCTSIYFKAAIDRCCTCKSRRRCKSRIES